MAVNPRLKENSRRWPKIGDPNLLPHRIADVLREAIISVKLSVGEKLPENELSLAMKVSRTPIRQALHILELEGFIEMIPRQGAFVSQLKQNEIEELYQILEIIEIFSIEQLINDSEKTLIPLEEILSRMAEQIERQDVKEIIQANFDFHNTIVRMARNQKLLAIYNSVRNPTRIYQSIGLSSEQYWMESLQDHYKILDAIRRNNGKLATRHCKEHIRKRCNRVMQSPFETSPGSKFMFPEK